MGLAGAEARAGGHAVAGSQGYTTGERPPSTLVAVPVM